MKAALFGGTFDPIHEGHARLARAFAEGLGLERVFLMPTAVPPHKPGGGAAPPEDRLAMCRLAAGGDPLFKVCDYELSRGGASFTADTLDHLRVRYPEIEWYLLTGADMFLTLGTWRRFADIAAAAVLCAAPRGDADLNALREYAAVLESRGARTAVLDIPVMDVSSTLLRRRLAQGEPTDGLLPPAVAAYIRERGLYRDSPPASASADESYMEILRGRLSKKRFKHSLAVAEQAKRLAGLHGADPAKAYTAGLLHDIMKNEPPEAQLQMLDDFGIILDTAERASPGCWHAMAGAAFLERVLGVRDADILNAVRYHTTARAGMSPLEIVIYLADYTSADRDYPDVAVMRRLADADPRAAMLYALKYTIRELLDKDYTIHPDAIRAYNEFITAERDNNPAVFEIL